MNTQWNEIVQDALELKATRAAIASVDKVKFSNELRQMCVMNYCGNYGKNWMCPPGVGALKELKEQVFKFQQGLVFQTVHELENSFDVEGMEESQSIHGQILQNILEKMKTKYEFTDMLPLNVGACNVCKQCTYPLEKECLFPEKAIASVEAYGINVMALVTECGFPYNNGENTVSYVGFILFNEL